MNKKQPKRKTTKVLSYDYLDFSFTLNLSSEEASIINYQSFTSTKDLEFIANDEKILDKITFSSSSNLINNLIFMNKSNKSKIFIELVTYNSLFLNDDEKFFSQIFSYVTEHSFLFITQTQLTSEYSNIKFSIKVNGEELRCFVFGVKKEENEENDKENKKDKEKEEENDENEGLKPIEKQKKECFSHKRESFDELISKLNGDFISDFIIFDINNIIDKQITSPNDLSNISLEELIKLINHIKSENSTTRIITIFPIILKNINIINYSMLTNLSLLLASSDISIFDKKEAIAYFNLSNSLNNQNFKEEKGKISDEALEKLYIGSFEDVKKVNLNGKIVFFIDELSKVVYFEGKGSKIVNNSSYLLSLIPKVNHTNQKLIDEYKKQVFVNKELLKSVFIGGFLSRYLQKVSIHSSVSTGSEISKRILELLKLELDFPLESDFYLVSVKNLNKNHADIEKKEKNFKLDCTNINQSRLGEYNPLKDNNLFSFFSSNINRKHLKNVGFINTKGFILEESDKKVYSSKEKDVNEVEREKKLLIAVKENEAKSKEQIRRNLINKSKQLHDQSIRDLEKMSRIKDYSKENQVMLPSFSSHVNRFSLMKSMRKSVVGNVSNSKVKTLNESGSNVEVKKETESK